MSTRWRMTHIERLCIHRLQAAKHDIDFKGDGRGSLHRAAAHGSRDVLMALLDEGENVNGFDRDGWTALHYAVVNANVETILALLHRNADVEARDRNGWTPLHWAAWCGRNTSALTLLHAAADFDISSTSRVDDLHLPDGRGRTPLHLSVLAHHPATALLLVAAGAGGLAVLHDDGLSKKSGMKRILKLDALRAAAEAGSLPLLQRVVESPEIRGLASDLRSRRLKAAVRHAFRHNQPQCAAYLQALQARHVMERLSIAPIGLSPALEDRETHARVRCVPQGNHRSIDNTCRD